MVNEVEEVVFDAKAAAERTGEIFARGASAVGFAPNPVAQEAPVVVETPIAETPVAETPEPRVYKGEDLKAKFETEDLDELHQKYTALAEKAKSADKLGEYEQKLAELEAYRNFVDNPYGNEKLKGIDAFSRKTGVSDLGVAAQFVGKTVDEIGQTPVEAMALARVMQNPAILNTMPFDKIVEAVSEQTGIDTDTKPIELSASQMLGLTDSLAVINAAYNKPDEAVDRYNEFKTKRETTEATFKANVASWEGKINVDLPNIELALEGEQKLALSVSKETKQLIENEIRQTIQIQGVPHSIEAQKQLENYARSRAIQLEAENAIKLAYEEGKKTSSGVAKEEALKEIHNPAPVVRTDKAAVDLTEDPNKGYLDYLNREAKKYAR
jgi:hypothetical protein